MVDVGVTQHDRVGRSLLFSPVQPRYMGKYSKFQQSTFVPGREEWFGEEASPIRQAHPEV